MNELLKLNWKVWDNSPLVTWEWNGNTVSLNFNYPPISISFLEKYNFFAIATDQNESMSGNLNLYSLEGKLLKVFSFPKINGIGYFTGLKEIKGRNIVEASICFPEGKPWPDAAAEFNIETGELAENFHRLY